jgi:transcriptional regulator GlxA family with amidase domain
VAILCHNLHVARKPTFERFQPRRLAVVAFDGVILGDLAIPTELFGRVRIHGQELYQVRICSAASRVRSKHVTLEVPHRLSELARADTILVPGLEDIDRVPDEIVRALRRAIDRGARVASICTGAFILAATGALDGLRATTHWLGAAELARRHPKIEVDPQVLYVDNGELLTSAGAAAGHDLCLHLVRRDFGAEIAARTARMAVMPLERAGGQAQFIAYSPPDDAMGGLLEWLDENLGRELSLSAIARRAAMSTRTLSRRFRQEVGATPAAWLAEARTRRSQRLLETTDFSIERIAGEVGFHSPTVLREHFGRIVGTTPLAYRRSFRRA